MLRARRAIDDNLNRGVNVLESAQGLAILLSFYYSRAQWFEGWLAGGALSRLLVPLGLHHAQETVVGLGTAARAQILTRMALVPAAKDDVEREERRALVWWAVTADVAQSANSGLAGSFPIDEIVRSSSLAHADRARTFHCRARTTTFRAG